MPLVSQQFKNDDELEQCLVDDVHHVVPGVRGPHVAKIQEALIKLGEGVISAAELSTMQYGNTTAQSVLAYKTRRGIINKAYQRKPDNIVGKMTIARLDDDMEKFEKKQASRLVALTEAGAPHDHAKCPRLEAGTHKGTPINPQGFGRKINIYGDHETDYLGFEDYAIDPAYRFQDDGGLSPLTWAPPAQGGLADHCASDICMRSSPVYDEKDRVRGLIKPRSTTGEIKRIAMPGCRLTYAGSDDNVKLFGSKVLQLGALMETVVIIEPAHVDPSGTFFPESRLIVYVLTIF